MRIFQRKITQSFGRTQRNIDKSVNMLDKVINSMAVLVGLITIVIIIAIALGFFEFNKWKEIRKEAEQQLALIKNMQKEAKEELNIFRSALKLGVDDLYEMPKKELKDRIKHKKPTQKKPKVINIIGKTKSKKNAMKNIYL